MYICKKHINMQNLDGENISCIDGSRSCGTTLFGGGANGRAPGWKPGSRGRGSLPPFIVPKKIEKKLPNKYRTS
jgi:hypothetical protein